MKALSSILKGIIYIPCTAALFFITYLNFTGSSFMPMTKAETVEFQTNNVSFYLFFLAALALLIALTYAAFRDRNGFFSESGTILFFLIGSVLYLVFGLYLIFRVPMTIRSDAKIIYQLAGQIKDGDFSSLYLDKAAGAAGYADSYLAKNPHQIGIVFLLSLLLRFLPNVRFIFILNLFLIILNNLLVLNISAELFNQDDHVCFVTVLMSFLMLPHFFLCIYCYGIIPGLAALLIMFLALVRFEKTGNLLHAAAAAAAASFAVVIRSNYLIGVIAGIILLLAVFFRSFEQRGRKGAGGRFRYLVTAILLVLAMFVPTAAIRFGVTRMAGVKITDSVPKSAWVAMGLSEGSRTEGWYNSYVYEAFAENGYNEQATDAAARALIAERVDKFREDHDYAYTFFMRKIAATWTEPTFQSVWIGPLDETAEEIGGHLYHSLYTGGTAYEICFLICSIVYLVLLVGCVLFLLRGLYRLLRSLAGGGGKQEAPPLYAAFPLLFLLGGFLFHLVWETKSLYVMSCVYVLLPLAARGLSFDRN